MIARSQNALAFSIPSWAANVWIYQSGVNIPICQIVVHIYIEGFTKQDKEESNGKEGEGRIFKVFEV